MSAPQLEPVDTRGAGDSYGAGVAAVLAGDAAAIRAIAEQVRLDEIEEQD